MRLLQKVHASFARAPQRSSMKWLATAQRWLLTRHLPAKNLARRSPNPLARSTPRIGRALAQRRLGTPRCNWSGRKNCEKDELFSRNRPDGEDFGELSRAARRRRISL